MPNSNQKYHKFTHSRPVVGLVLLCFFCQMAIPAGLAQAQGVPNSVLGLPVPGTMVQMSPGFMPALLKGLTIHPENPLAFNFYVDTGDSGLADQALKDESTTLIKYFLAALTVPDKDLWVNLSPYENDRIIAPGFGLTEMGRDLLAQDYLLKQLASSLMYPERDLGKKFWDRVYKKAQARYGTTELPFNTFNKVWIVPDEAVVYEHNATAFIISSRLKIMMEEDYLALGKNEGSDRFGMQNVDDQQTKAISQLSSSVMKEILIPEIEREVNEGKNFAGLRQIYHAMILATWYKRSLQESLLGRVYVNRNKVKGVDVEDKDIKQKIYDQYLTAFRKGVYSYIKEDLDPVTQQLIPRKYFSGGFDYDIDQAYQPITDFEILGPEARRMRREQLAAGLEGYGSLFAMGTGMVENSTADTIAQAGGTEDRSQLATPKNEAKAILVAQRVGREFGLGVVPRTRIAEYLLGQATERALRALLTKTDKDLAVDRVIDYAEIGMQQEEFWKKADEFRVGTAQTKVSKARARDEVLARELRAGHLLQISRDWLFVGGEENWETMGLYLENVTGTIFTVSGENILPGEVVPLISERSGLFVVEYVDGSANLIFVEDRDTLLSQPQVLQERDRLYSAAETMTQRIRNGWTGEMSAEARSIIDRIETLERWRNVNELPALRDWLLKNTKADENKNLVQDEIGRFLEATAAADRSMLAEVMEIADKVDVGAITDEQRAAINNTRDLIVSLAQGVESIFQTSRFKDSADQVAQWVEDNPRDTLEELPEVELRKRTQDLLVILNSFPAGVTQEIDSFWASFRKANDNRRVVDFSDQGDVMVEPMYASIQNEKGNHWMHAPIDFSRNSIGSLLRMTQSLVRNIGEDPAFVTSDRAARLLEFFLDRSLDHFLTLLEDMQNVDGIDVEQVSEWLDSLAEEEANNAEAFYYFYSRQYLPLHKILSSQNDQSMLAGMADRIKQEWVGEKKMPFTTAMVTIPLAVRENDTARLRSILLTLRSVAENAQDKELIARESRNLTDALVRASRVAALDQAMMVSGENLVPVQVAARYLHDFVAERVSGIEEQIRQLLAGEADLPEVTDKINESINAMRDELRSVNDNPLIRALKDTVANGFLKTETGVEFGNEWDIIGALSGVSGQLVLLSMFGEDEKTEIENSIKGIIDSTDRVRGYGLAFLDYASRTQQLELLGHSIPANFVEGFYDPSPSRADKASLSDNVISFPGRELSVDIMDEDIRAKAGLGPGTTAPIAYLVPGNSYSLLISRLDLEQTMTINILGDGTQFGTDFFGRKELFPRQGLEFGPEGEAAWVRISFERDEGGTPAIMTNLLETRLNYEVRVTGEEPTSFVNAQLTPVQDLQLAEFTWDQAEMDLYTSAQGHTLKGLDVAEDGQTFTASAVTEEANVMMTALVKGEASTGMTVLFEQQVVDLSDRAGEIRPTSLELQNVQAVRFDGGTGNTVIRHQVRDGRVSQSVLLADGNLEVSYPDRATLSDGTYEFGANYKMEVSTPFEGENFKRVTLTAPGQRITGVMDGDVLTEVVGSMDRRLPKYRSADGVLEAIFNVLEKLVLEEESLQDIQGTTAIGKRTFSNREVLYGLTILENINETPGLDSGAAGNQQLVGVSTDKLPDVMVALAKEFAREGEVPSEVVQRVANAEQFRELDGVRGLVLQVADGSDAYADDLSKGFSSWLQQKIANVRAVSDRAALADGTYEFGVNYKMEVSTPFEGENFKRVTLTAPNRQTETGIIAENVLADLVSDTEELVSRLGYRSPDGVLSVVFDALFYLIVDERQLGNIQGSSYISDRSLSNSEILYGLLIMKNVTSLLNASAEEAEGRMIVGISTNKVPDIVVALAEEFDQDSELSARVNRDGISMQSFKQYTSKLIPAIGLEPAVDVGELQLKEAFDQWVDQMLARLRQAPGTAADTRDTERVGGIDLDPTLLNLQIKRDANGVPLPLPQQPIDNMNIEGFYPVIFNITPAENLYFLLGLSDEGPEPDQISLLKQG